ncbi:MAG: hypothetical protein PWQ09_904 [Candidatus Cloacimonadota bacterium]|jgi:signal transduction histidine kinase/Tfp pilus assembly protein PilF|nr:hypothetical protein [Candidatus Cloacimonadota bacterium]
MRKFVLIFLLFYLISGIYADEIQEMKYSLPEKTVSEKIVTLNEIAKSYWLVNPGSTFVYAEKAYQLASQRDNKTQMAIALKNKGVAYYFLSKFDEALQQYEKALDICQKNDDLRGLADLYNNIGLVYQKMNKFDLTLENYLKSLELEKQLGNQKGIADSMVNLANFFYFLGKYDKAQEYFTKSLEQFSEIDHQNGISMALVNLAAIQDDRKNYEEAIQLYKRSLQIDLQQNNYNGIATNYNNIGFSYFNLKNYPEAEDYYNRALKIQKRISDNWGISNTYYNLGELYLKWNKLQKSSDNFIHSLELANKMHTTDLQLKASKGLAEIHYKLGNYKKAYEFYEVYATINDSLYKELGNKKLVDIWSAYQIQQKDEQNKILEQKNKIMTLELQKKKLIEQRLILGLVIVVILVLILFKYYRTKSRTNQLLQKLVRERTTKLQIEGDERKRAEKKLQQKHQQINSIHNSLENKIEEALKSLRNKNMRLIQQSRQAALGEMTGHILAQWQQPLTQIYDKLQNHHENWDDLDKEEKKQILQTLQSFIKRSEEFEYIFKACLHTEEFSIKSVVQDVIELVRHSLIENRVQLKVDFQSECRIEGYRDLFLQVVLNIVNNSRYFLKKRKILNPTLEINLEAKKNRCVLTIIDNAGGIDEEIIDKIFEPYFSTKKQGEFRGLGLFMAKTVVQEMMRGKITAENYYSGTKFTIEL